MMSSSFGALLAPQCIVVDADIHYDALNGLLEEERAYTADMNCQRLREFTAGRHCARAALAALNFPPVAIGKGSKGEPLFVAGVTGSITHTQNYCAAALSLTKGIRAVGIDAQTNIALEESLYRRVLRRNPRSTPDRQGFCEGTLIFSINEAFYKAICPVSQRPVYWTDWCMHVEQNSGKCEIEILTPKLASLLAPMHVDIRYGFDQERIYSAVTLWDGETGQQFTDHATARKSVS